MEKDRRGKIRPVGKKGKSKQGKDELDRLKQAEKKKRRLEKALATSAAIRSELEKKKQKKIEELQRLDEEAAATAEAVALHVLLGEDADEPHGFMLSNRKKYDSWNCSNNIDLINYQSFTRYSIGLESSFNGYGPANSFNDWVSRHPFDPCMQINNLHSPYYAEASQLVDISAGLIAAQAVSSLQIGEDSDGSQFSGQAPAKAAVNKMLGGGTSVNNLYRKYDF